MMHFLHNIELDTKTVLQY